jgi:predicted MFS family arabinose efflux permease
MPDRACELTPVMATDSILPPMNEGPANRLADSVYERLANEEDARVCTDISDEACRYVPFNFVRIVGASLLTKTGDALINPKTVLAWLVNFMGAPAFVLALLVPLRESGSMIPQLAIAAWVRRKPIRKWTWVLGAVLQGAAVAAIGACAFLLRGLAAGVAVLAALVLFSLARGLCSVSSKDVLGKTIPKRRRGRVGGIASGLSGVVVVLVGLGMYLGRPDDADAVFYVALLVGAALLWWLAAAIYASIEEEPGETGGGGNAASVALRSLGLLGRDRDFRRFVITRALLISSALAAPYYVALAQQASGGSTATLGLLILAGGLAASLSAPTWGRMADRSSRRVLLLAATLTCLLNVGVFLVENLIGSVPSWVYPAAFLGLGIAHSGIRLGRKTYLVDMAGGNRRTDYVAVSNTVIGLILLLAGSVTAALSFLAPDVLILALAGTTLAGIASGLGLPEVQES